MVYSIIQKSQLEGAQRIDAEYYQQEYLDVVDKISSLPHDTLQNISKSLLSFGAYSLTSYIQWKDQGIPFITAENVKEGFIDFSDVRYIDETVDEILKKSRVYENDVLLAMSGKVGDASIAVNIPSKLNSNQDIVKIRLKQGFSPYVLAVFLNSKYGRLQVLRLPVGSVQQHIFLWQTASLLIPKFSTNFTNEIEQLYKQSLQAINNSERFNIEAENLLLEELGLENFQREEEVSYIVHFSDIQSANRMDADYFQPKYQRIIDKIIKKKRMSEIAKRIKNSVKPSLDTEYNYIEISDVNADNGEVTFNKILGKELPANAKIGLSGGEFIISKVRPTRGAVAIIPQEFSANFIASGAFSVFNIDNPTREYLQVVFRSIVGRLQLERPTTGTSYPTITDEDIENVWIPDISFEIQEKIAELVRKSHEARRESKRLLEEAKRTVEEMIER